MNLRIEEGQTVLDLKHQFADKYEGLKIELFKKSHDDGESSDAKMRVFGTEAIENLVSVSLPVVIEIHKEMTVQKLKRLLKNKLDYTYKYFVK